MFQKIDEKILGGCQRFAHWFQTMTGRTNYFIAKIGVMISFLRVMFCILNYFHKIFFLETHMHGLIMSILLMFILFRDVVRLENAEKSAMSEEKAAIREKFTHYFWRLLWVFMVISEVSISVGMTLANKYGVADIMYQVSFSLGTGAFYYFSAVDPLTPRKGKIKEWISEFAAGFKKLEPVKVAN